MLRTATAPRRDETDTRVRHLDGIRGVAIIVVVLDHTHEPLAHAGYLGVDIFFALSGFLISSILLRERAKSGRISLGAFYTRRALRLYPALLALCLIVLIVPRTMGFTGAVDALPATGLSATYLVDLASWLHWPVTLGALPPLWTLGVEEMFYLVWPAVLILLLRSKRPERLVPAVLMLGIINAYVALVTGSGHGANHLGVPLPVYFRPDARAGSILIGCLCAWIVHRHHGRLPRALSWIGLAGLAFMLAIGPDVSSQWAYRFAMPLTAISTGLVLIGLSEDRTGPVGRLLSWRPLGWAGLISYSLYLANPLAFQIVHVHMSLSRSAEVIPIILISVALAVASYRFVETPFLRLKHRVRSSGSLDAPAPVQPSPVG